MRGRWVLLALLALAGACGARSTLGVPEVPPSPFVELALGRGWTCARTQRGAVSCWGESQGLHPEPFPSPNLVDLGAAVRISGALDDVCALIDDGTVRCWGENTAGQLGIDPAQSAPDWIVPTPQVVPNLPSGIVKLSTASFSCVIGQDASVVCFGYVPIDATPTFDARPVFHLPAGAESVSVSGTLYGSICEGQCFTGIMEGYACAIDSEGTAWCWGLNEWGVCGDGSSREFPTSPVRVKFDGRFQSIATGGSDACGIDEGGDVYCWGYGGGVGDGSQKDWLVPTPIGLSQATALAAAFDHMCALGADGSVWCWGDNTSAQVGVAGGVEKVLAPTRVQGLGSALAIGAGDWHSCAIVSDGGVWCWGSNDHGQLGVGGVGMSATPLHAR